MATYRVLYTDRGDYSLDLDVEEPIYAAIDAEIVDARLDHNAIDWDAYARHLQEADALVCFRMPVDRRALDLAPQLKVAVRAGVGFENFDLDAFAERGIAACNVPDYGSEEVAVHAFSQVLALRRRTAFFDRALPLTSRTRHLIGERELALMQPTAVLVNTSRGLVVDQLALARALQAKTLEGAACDVWEHEPVQPDHPLFQCSNFIGSPHVAGLSVEGERDNRTKQAQEVARVLRGEPPRNQVVSEDVLYGAPV